MGSGLEIALFLLVVKGLAGSWRRFCAFCPSLALPYLHPPPVHSDDRWIECHNYSPTALYHQKGLRSLSWFRSASPGTRVRLTSIDYGPLLPKCLRIVVHMNTTACRHIGCAAHDRSFEAACLPIRNAADEILDPCILTLARIAKERYESWILFGRYPVRIGELLCERDIQKQLRRRELIFFHLYRFFPLCQSIGVVDLDVTVEGYLSRLWEDCAGTSSIDASRALSIHGKALMRCFRTHALRKCSNTPGENTIAISAKYKTSGLILFSLALSASKFGPRGYILRNL